MTKTLTREMFVRWGRKGGRAGDGEAKARGGHARAAALSPARRRAIARKAAAARWANRAKRVKAVRKG